MILRYIFSNKNKIMIFIAITIIIYFLNNYLKQCHTEFLRVHPDKSLVVHITYFHKDIARNPQKRISYVQKILDEYDKFTCVRVHIYIHTNTSIDHVFNPPKNCSFDIIVHELRKDENPHYLTWKSRKLIKSQRNDFDYFCYSEDDILMKESTFQYWLKYKDMCIENQYNLGFLRVETDKDQNMYVLDVTNKLKNIVTINDIQFVKNDDNPYCALWIYDKSELNNIINSDLYDLEKANSSSNIFLYSSC